MGWFDETPQSVVFDVRYQAPFQHCIQVARLRLPVGRVVRLCPLLPLTTTFCFALFRLSRSPCIQGVREGPTKKRKAAKAGKKRDSHLYLNSKQVTVPIIDLVESLVALAT